MMALLGAALSLVGFGLLYGLSPSTYGIVVHLLATSARGARSVAWLCAGMALAALVSLLVFRAVDPETLISLVRTRAEEVLVRRAVDMVAGVCLLLAGAWAVRDARRPRKPKAPARADARADRPDRLVALGAIEALTSLSGVATMYVAGRVVTSATHHLSLQAVLVAILLAAVVSQYLLLALAWERMPALARRATALYDRLSAMDRRPLVAAGLLIAGAVFLVLGIFGHHAA